MIRRMLFLAPALLACFSCSTQPSPQERAQSSAATAEPGASKATAIEVCNPPGERAYLNQLFCADGTHPTYKRIGNVGYRMDFPKALSKEQIQKLELDVLQKRGQPLAPGERDYHIVDQYEVACGATTRVMYMDMYHCQAPPEPPIPAPSASGSAPFVPLVGARFVCDLSRAPNAASAPTQEPLQVSFDASGAIFVGPFGRVKGKVTEEAVLAQIHGPMWIKIDRQTKSMSTVIYSGDGTSIEMPGSGKCREDGPEIVQNRAR